MKTAVFLLRRVLAFSFIVLAGIPAQAQIVYSTSGSTYTQDFNSFDSFGSSNGAWTQNSTLLGWYGMRQDGITPTQVTYSTGVSSTQNQLLNVGNNSDRALGAQTLQSNTNSFYYGMSLSNTTGSTLGQFSLSYDGEQWRVIQNDIADTLTVQYQIFNSGSGTITAASGWVAIPDLTFTTPQVSASPSTSLNGNSSANRVAGISSTVSGFSWGNGQELWIRWSDVSATNQRAMMGIDNITFSAIPEPSTYLLLGLGLSVLWFCRRKTGNPKSH